MTGIERVLRSFPIDFLRTPHRLASTSGVGAGRFVRHLTSGTGVEPAIELEVAAAGRTGAAASATGSLLGLGDEALVAREASCSCSEAGGMGGG